MNRIKFLKKKLFFWLIPIFIILFTLAFTSIKIFILKKNVDNEIIAKNNFNRTMIVVADIDYEPYSFINEKGEPAGHDIELISAIANKMKYNLDIRLMKWKDCIETAITGKADVILGLDYKPKEFSELFLSSAISSDPFVCFGRKQYKSVHELHGKKLAALENSGCRSEFLEPYELIKNTKEYETYTEVFQSVISGENDYGVARYSVGRRILAKQKIKSIYAVGPKMTNTSMCIGVSKKSSISITEINKSLREMMHSGVIEELSNKWLGHYIELIGIEDFALKYWYIIFIAACIILLYLSLSMLYFYRKKSEIILNKNENMKRVHEYQKFMIDATQGLYENIYEIDITHNCAGSEETKKYFKRLGLSEDTPYDEAMQEIAKQQVKKEFIQGYIDTFNSKNILKTFESGINNLSYDFMITSNGKSYYWFRISTRIFYWKYDDSVRMLIFRENIDKRKKMEFAAKMDMLTGFYNKKTVENFIEKILESEKDINDKCVFIIIDVDQFKLANDYWGHSFGDKLLLKITEKLKKYFRSTDIIGRFGGDEFLVFLQDFYSIEWLKEKLNGLNEILTEDIEAEGKICRISVSIGAAVYPKMMASYEEMFEKADKELYIVKQKGRNGNSIYIYEEEY